MSLQALWREVTQWNCAVRRAENENAKVRHGQLIRSGRQHLDQRVPTHLSRKEPHKDSYRTRRSFWSGCVSDANCPDTNCLQNSDCEVTFADWQALYPFGAKQFPATLRADSESYRSIASVTIRSMIPPMIRKATS